MICSHCGHGSMRLLVTQGLAECMSAKCGKWQDLEDHGAVDRHRLRRIAMGRIPANQDCPHTSTCNSALRGECYRPQFQGEEYSCPVAREVAA